MLHPCTALYEHAQVGPFIVTEGHGIWVKDVDGREYLDAVAGLWNINVGHGRHEIARAVADQMERLAYYPTYGGTSNPAVIRLSKLLAQIAPEGITRFLYTLGGGDSNDTAFKLVRYYHALRGRPDKRKIISLSRGFHGSTIGSLSATGLPRYKDKLGALALDFQHIVTPYCYRCPLGRSCPEAICDCAQQLELLIQAEGADTVAAFVAEPVLAAGGVIIPPANYFPAIREICDRHGVLFISDEVVTGFGRSGKMFGIQHWGVKPDMIVCAKGMTSAYLPLGAVGVTDAIYEAIKVPDTTFLHGSTYTGHAACCAAALKNVEIIIAENLVENAARMGQRLLDGCREFLKFPYVGDVRGLGLMVAIELVADKATKARLPEPQHVTRQLRAAALSEGLMPRGGSEMIALSPPLIITAAEVDLLLGKVERVLWRLSPPGGPP